MSVRVAILASGSNGNCALVSSGNTRLLIDAGISRKAIDIGFARIGERPEDITAVCVSHGHSDHSSGLTGLIGAYQMPVYSSAGTRNVLRSVLDKSLAVCHELRDDMATQIGDIYVLPVAVPHDCQQPTAFALVVNGMRFGFVTDVGYMSEYMLSIFSDSDFLFLESNHDRDAVMAGAYPPALKGRVLENHLCNDKVCGFIADHMSSNVHHLVLGHLSSNNNDEQLVHAMASRSLQRSGNINTKLDVIPPGGSSEVFVF